MRKAFIQLHIAIFLAGFTGVLGHLIQMEEGLLVTWRLLISAATMWVVYGLSGRLQRLPVKDILGIAVLGGVAALHWVAFFGAIKYGNVSIALVCFSAVGFFTALLEPVLFGKKIIWIEVGLGAVVIAGIAVIFHFHPRFDKGMAYGMLSALLGAIFPLYNRVYMQRMNASTLMTWELTGGFLCMVFILPLYVGRLMPYPLWPPLSDWPWILILSWACSVWAFQLTANALKSISAFTVNLSFNLEPVYGILMAFLFLGEQTMMGSSFYAALLLIILALLLQSGRVYKNMPREHRHNA